MQEEVYHNRFPLTLTPTMLIFQVQCPSFSECEIAFKASTRFILNVGAASSIVAYAQTNE